VRQILSQDVLDMVRRYPNQHIDVRLSAAGGKVRAYPALVINTGTPPLVDPTEIGTEGGIRAPSP